MSRSKKTLYNDDEFDNYIKNKKRSKYSTKSLQDSIESSESGFTSSDDSELDRKFELYKYKKSLKMKKVDDDSTDDDLTPKKHSKREKVKKEKRHHVNHMIANYSYFNDQIINNVYNPVNIVNITSTLNNNITIFLTNRYNDGDLVSFFFFGNTVQNVVFYTNYKIHNHEQVDNTDRIKYNLQYNKEIKLLLVKNIWYLI